MSLTTINSNNIFQKDVIGNVRKVQEDSHDMAVLTPNGDVFVVCDGMGGHVGGKKASSLAVESIIEHLKKEKYSNPIQALNNALQFANMQILGYANEHPELKGMGTTACILLLQGDKAYIAHVGDSRIYLYLGKEKRLHRITKDHSYVQTLVDAGEISDEMAESHPNKNRILKALGIKQDLQPTVNAKHILPKNGDMFLICTDGLNGMLTDGIMEGVLSGSTTIEQKGNMLIDLALEEGGLDNITLQLIKISDSPHKNSIFKSHNPAGETGGDSTSIIMKILKWAAVAIVALAICFGGCIAIHHFKTKKSQEREIEQLRANIKEAEKGCEELRGEFDEEKGKYDEIATETGSKKEQWDRNTQNEGFRGAYDLQKNIDDSAKKKLDDLENKRDSVCNRATALKNSFEADCTNVVEKYENKTIKNQEYESNNNREE